jgi:hypothetical protein
MNHFEELCKYLLEMEGYWVRTNLKVDLSVAEKEFIGKKTMPRPEIDIVAYKPASNELLVIEVKSFLNSSGVYLEHVETRDDHYDGYKILTDLKFQEVVCSALTKQLQAEGMLMVNPTLKLGLIAGKIHMNRYEDLKQLAESRRWFLWGPKDLKQRVDNLSRTKYEDNPFVVTAKILA